MSLAASGRRDIFGVDFSGAKTACNKIWLSRGEVAGTRLCILECYPLSEANSAKLSREHCLHILLCLICSSKCSIFGMDFPFGIPFQLMQGRSWEEFIRDFPQLYVNEDEFRDINRKLSGNVELKRSTDKEVKAPFCVYNLRLYRQTYYGIRDIIRPLVISDAASILPLQFLRADVPWLMEICPASTLKKEGLYSPYKGKGAKEKATREHILDRLAKKALDVPEDIRDKALQNSDGDALDSIIAAYSVFCVRNMLVPETTIGEPYLKEGFTFI
jgi:hypothetical protein